MDTKEDIIATETFGGWPIYKRNIREILMMLGAKEENGKIFFDSNDEVLDVYPKVFVDDGMGYGVDENYIVDVDKDSDSEYGMYVNIWRDAKDKNLDKE